MIKENLEQVEKNIENASQKAGRRQDEVTLIAVSKTKPVENIQEAYQAGIRDFGENKVQELVDKYETLPKDIRWHLIGHLQRNKVKYIVDKVYLIHSVDSIRLAQQIEAEAKKKQVDVRILIQVNVAQEDTKFGFDISEAVKAVKEISQMPHIHIQGLMTIAPFTEDAEENRVYFTKLRQLCVDINAKNIDNVTMDVLSMGMTGDYTIAIEEGATMVRVGTGIFGERKTAKDIQP